MPIELRRIPLSSIGASLAVIAVVGGLAVWARGAPAEIPLKIEPLSAKSSKTPGNPNGTAPSVLLVQVSGAVARPGIYEFLPKTRVRDAIGLAGGPTADAVLDKLNLVQLLHDGQKIVVPSTKSASTSKRPKSGGGASAARRSRRGTSPPPLRGLLPMDIEPGDLVASSPESNRDDDSDEADRPKNGFGGGRERGFDSDSPDEDEVGPGASGANDPDEDSSEGPPESSRSARNVRPENVLPEIGSVRLNQATIDELDRLPGIGPTIAGRIVAERKRRGGFRRASELTEVRGISPKVYHRIAPFLTI